MDYHVFISYSHKDMSFVKSIVKELIDSGIQPWWDKDEILFGDDLTVKITEGIESTRIILAIISSSTSQSWARNEFAFALDKAELGEMRIIPILIEHCVRPIELGERKYVDLRDGNLDNLKPLIYQIKKELQIDIKEDDRDSRLKIIEQSIDLIKDGSKLEKKNSLKNLFAESSLETINYLFANFESLDTDIQVWILNHLGEFKIEFKYIKPHIERIVRFDNDYISVLALGIMIEIGELRYLSNLFSKINLGDSTFNKVKYQKSLNKAIETLASYDNYNLENLKKIKSILEKGLRYNHRDTIITTLGTCVKLKSQFDIDDRLKKGIIKESKIWMNRNDKDISKLADFVYNLYLN